MYEKHDGRLVSLCVFLCFSSVSRAYRAVHRALTLRSVCVYIQNLTFAAVVQRYFDLHLTIFVEMMEKDAAAVEKDAAKSKHSKAEKSEETQVSVTKRVARESRKRPRECWLNCYVRVARKEAASVEGGRCKVVGWGKLSQEERDAFKADHAALDEAQSKHTDAHQAWVPPLLPQVPATTAPEDEPTTDAHQACLPVISEESESELAPDAASAIPMAQRWMNDAE